jgi:hypothetical protein
LTPCILFSLNGVAVNSFLLMFGFWSKNSIKLNAIFKRLVTFFF